MAQNGGIRGPGQTFTTSLPPIRYNLSEQQQIKSTGNWPGIIQYQNYVTPGTYTFSAPISGNISYMAIGGGGGSSRGKTGDGGGGGGGGGGCIFASNVLVSQGDQLTIVVGAGGTATTTFGVDGNPGGNSSVTLTQAGKTDFVITAEGGLGGKIYNLGATGYANSSVTSNYNGGTVAGGTTKTIGQYAGGQGGGPYNGGGGGGGAASAGGVGGGGKGAIAGTFYQGLPASPGPTGGQGGAANTTGGAPSSGGGAGGAGGLDATGGGGGGGYTYSSVSVTSAGSAGNGLITLGSKGGDGGFPGGGGGGCYDTGYGTASVGGNGFVRIVWGTNASGARFFPGNALDT